MTCVVAIAHRGRVFMGADSLTRPYYIDDNRLVVGAENGSIFEVAPA